MLRCTSTASVKKVSIVRFEADLLNGTVTDHKTGLMWQQAAYDIARTLPEAKTYCNGLVLGGHNDWVLPRIDQLLTIVDYSRYGPAIHPALDCRLKDYLSSSTNAGNPDAAWVVNFTSGYAGWDDKYLEYSYVGCVRGGPW